MRTQTQKTPPTPKKTWTAPKVREIAVGMEINAYASAEIGR
jgi:coenzyme PQQ precursor peptide PqqA